MRKMKQLTAFLAIFILSSCAAVRVNQDYEMATDFYQYRKFAFAPEPSKTHGDVFMDSSLMQKRINSAIENIMRDNGFPQVADTQADFLVAYQLVVRTRVEADPVPGFGWGPYPYGYSRFGYPYWGGYGYYPETYIREYEEGTLIIDFMDRDTQQLFWRGIGTRRLSRQLSPEKVTDWVDTVVMEILDQYPPLPASN
jgi:hypothetical protein